MKVNGKSIESIGDGNKIIIAINKGATVVWEGIKSCFGKGYWRNLKPWSNSEVWRN